LGSRSIQGLEKLENLLELELGQYSSKMFEICPALLILDGKDE